MSDSFSHGDDEIDGSAEGQTQTLTRLQPPKMYKVILLNDHYTPMDFVIEVLISIFNKSAAEATGLMLEVHKRGVGIAGVFTYDIAMTKIDAVHKLAKEREFPLKCGFEEE